MRNVFAAEWKDDGTEISKIINGVTKTGYSHSSLIVNRKGYFWHCELMGFRKQAYMVSKIEDLKAWLKQNPRVHLFAYPDEFSDIEIEGVIKWWESKWKWHYGYGKLFSMIFIAPFRNQLIKYYKKHGHPYEPMLGNKVKDELVCSVAEDKSIKEGAGRDYFPELDEDCIVPGMWAKDKRFRRYNPI